MVSCILTGGMANTAFTIMATIAYAHKHNMPYAIPTHTSSPHWKHYKFGNVHYEDINTTGFFHYRAQDVFYEQRPYDVSYHEIPYHENIILEGHFQSWKYWLDHIDEIRDIFQWHIQPFSASGYEDYISVSVRRGDYLTMPDKLPPVTPDYLFAAINHFINKRFSKFIFTSDDINWCREITPILRLPESVTVEFSEENEDIDLRIISCCAGNILANSSYGLLAYYLNQDINKICIVPSIWFGYGYGKVDTTDLYPLNSIVI